MRRDELKFVGADIELNEIETEIRAWYDVTVFDSELLLRRMKIHEISTDVATKTKMDGQRLSCHTWENWCQSIDVTANDE